MARLIGAAVAQISISDGTLGIVDETCLSDIHHLHEPQGSWVRAAKGMVQVECPWGVITVRARVESWSSAPPADESAWDRQWRGRSGAARRWRAVSLLDGRLVHDPDGLPSPGLYRLRAHWALNPETGPFYSPFESGVLLETPSGHEQSLQDTDLYCLMQLWRLRPADAPS